MAACTYVRNSGLFVAIFGYGFLGLQPKPKVGDCYWRKSDNKKFRIDAASTVSWQPGVITPIYCLKNEQGMEPIWVDEKALDQNYSLISDPWGECKKWAEAHGWTWKGPDLDS